MLLTCVFAYPQTLGVLPIEKNLNGNRKDGFRREKLAVEVRQAVIKGTVPTG